MVTLIWRRKDNDEIVFEKDYERYEELEIEEDSTKEKMEKEFGKGNIEGTILF